MGAGEKGFHRARLLPAEDRNAFLAESGDAEVRSLLEAQEQASSLEDDPVMENRAGWRTGHDLLERQLGEGERGR